MKIDKIYVINLAKGFDDITERINELNLPNGIPYIVWNAVNGKELVKGNITVPYVWKQATEWKIESDNEWWTKDMAPGEIGCILSHYEVWSDVIKNNYDNVLVLEEDFKMEHNFPKIEQLADIPKGWDFVYLGKNNIPNNPDTPINKNISKPGYSYNTHAYLLSGEGAKKLVNKNVNIDMVPADEFIPAVIGVHPRQDLSTKFKDDTFNGYTFNKQYIKQTSVEGLSSSTIESNQIEKNQMNNYIEILDTSDWNAWVSKYINPAIARGEHELMIDELGPSVVEFSLFTTKFCEEFIQLAESKGTWTEGRHQHYPTNDMLMEVIGMKETYTRVIREFVAPLATWYWTLEGQGWDEMVDETFIIRYRPDKQGHLGLHHDYSQYTIAVKLNDEFEGGGTYFPAYKLVANPKRVGNAILHPGLVSHRHGGRPVLSGTRYINVSFIKNPKIMR